MRNVLAESVDYGVTLACWCTLYFAIRLYFEAKEQERMVREADLFARNAELNALHSQMHPHFLFNSLNAVSSLVVADRPEEACLMVSQLRGLLSAMLEEHDGPLSDLATELHHAAEYVEIQRTRFGDRLKFEFDIRVDASQRTIPRWLLLPVVENAVRYGLVADEEGTPIRLMVEEIHQSLVLTIENKLPSQQRHARDGGFGIGLRNTRELLHNIYGDVAVMSIKERAGFFVLVIELPMMHSLVEDGDASLSIPC